AGGARWGARSGLRGPGPGQGGARREARTGQTGAVTTTPETDGPRVPEPTDEAAARQLELWRIRDAVIGAEAAAGQLRARVKALGSGLDEPRRHARDPL